MSTGLKTDTLPGKVNRKGLSIPLEANSHGGLKLVSGDDQDDKIIRVALLDTTNNNAFAQNKGGVANGVVFGVMSDAIRATVVGRLRALFRQFQNEKRFALITDSVLWQELPDTGQLILSFRYICLESDATKDFLQPIG